MAEEPEGILIAPPQVQVPPESLDEDSEDDLQPKLISKGLSALCNAADVQVSETAKTAILVPHSGPPAFHITDLCTTIIPVVQRRKLRPET